MVFTKGDLLDQERKVDQSGLSKFFEHVQVLSDKQEVNYQKVLSHLQINEEEFLMIGNSLKSDVLPLVNIGAQAVHVPFHTTWQHEEVVNNEDANYLKIEKITDILKHL